MAPTTPEVLRSWGSPTILVDGQDVAGDDPAGACCRLYDGDTGSRGVPADALIRSAIERAVLKTTRPSGGDAVEEPT